MNAVSVQMTPGASLMTDRTGSLTASSVSPASSTSRSALPKVTDAPWKGSVSPNRRAISPMTATGSSSVRTRTRAQNGGLLRLGPLGWAFAPIVVYTGPSTACSQPTPLAHRSW